MIALTATESKVMYAVGYDEPTQRLHVQMRSSKDARMPGQLYEYAPVPPRLYAEFEAAPSKGEFLNRVIKRQCGCVKVNAAPEQTAAHAP